MADNTNKRPSASKTTKKVTANKNIFANFGKVSNSQPTSAKRKSSNSISATKTVARATATTAAAVGAIKMAKKMNGKSIAVIFICFILALAIGVGVCFFIGRNDVFEFIGNEELSLTLDETYTDEGVYIKEFGFDASKMAKVETNLKQNANGEYYAEEIGTYYMIYTVKTLKFGVIYPVSKIRLITFAEPSEGEN